MGLKSLKWGFSSTPSTPKLASVSLPDDNDIRNVAMKRPPTKAATTSTFGKVVPDTRSTTPLPGSYRTRRESVSGGQPSRTMPIHSKVVDAPQSAKVPRGGSLERTAPVSARSTRGGSSMLGQGMPLAGPSTSSTGGGPSTTKLKAHSMGWSSSQSVGSSWIQEPIAPSQATPSHPPHRIYATPRHTYGESSAHSSKAHPTRQSYAEAPSIPTRRSEVPVVKDVIVRQVPLKAESIVLSWPLAERNSGKRRQPRLYFDIAFDPMTPSNLRFQRHDEGIFRDLAPDDREMSACAHDGITNMVIQNDWLPGPISVERAQGIRCIDVFRAIYEAFNARLRSREKDQIPSSYLRACGPSFEQRCLDAPCLAEFEKKQGLRRVDLLKGTRIFQGLQRASDGHWVLQLTHPDPRSRSRHL